MCSKLPPVGLETLSASARVCEEVSVSENKNKDN